MVTVDEDILTRLLKAEAEFWSAGLLLREARAEIEKLRNAHVEQGIELSNYRILARRYGHQSVK